MYAYMDKKNTNTRDTITNTNKSKPVGKRINRKFTAFFLIESNKKTKAPTLDCFL